jgi:hypothetical protein
MNITFLKAATTNSVDNIDSILRRFAPEVGLNEEAHEAIVKTTKSISQMPVHGETEDIIKDLIDSKNIHVCEFNRSYFELYFDITINLFQGAFPLISTDDDSNGLWPDRMLRTVFATIV